jgi:hypothetical protein
LREAIADSLNTTGVVLSGVYTTERLHEVAEEEFTRASRGDRTISVQLFWLWRSQERGRRHVEMGGEGSNVVGGSSAFASEDHRS